MQNRKVILYIAASLDGYIAKPNDDLGFLQIVEQAGEDYGYADFIAGIDTVIIGRKTYDWIMKEVPQYVHADKTTYVITRTPRAATGTVNFYTGDLQQLVNRLKNEPGKNIFVDGGAEIVAEMLKHHLIDEYIVSIIPVMVGVGTRLFKDGIPEQNLQLVSCKWFPKGLVQLHYRNA